jgi:hypothetical protein
MNTIIASLSELIKMLTDAFRLSAMFPALVFILLNHLFIVSQFKHLPLFNELVGRDLKDQALIAGALALLLGYTLNAIEVPVVRFYEGYPWKDSWWGRFLIGWQQGRIKWLKDKKQGFERELVDKLNFLSSSSCETHKSLDVKIKKCRSELGTFPQDLVRVLPTRLGNVIAAFEAYPWQTYRMDGVTFWPRMLPILAKEGFAPYVTQSRATTDFLLNISLLMGIFGLECILLRIFFLPDIGWWLPLTGFIVALLFYKSAIVSTYNWAAMFRTAFDLYRYQLADALGLKPVDSFEKEQRLWSELTGFWQKQQATFEGFNHTSQTWPVSISNDEGKED